MKNKINKILNLVLLLSVLNGNILPMQKSDLESEAQIMEIDQDIQQELSLLGLPAEVIEYILYQIVKPYEDNINKVNNIFDYCQIDLKPLVSDLSGVSLTSKDLRFWSLDLINRLKKLKEKKYQKLINQIKNQYQGISKDELNDRLRNTLNRYVNRNNLEEATKLILAGANVNEKNHGGYSALMFAAMKGYKDIVQLLINNGANVNEKNNVGNNALMIVARNGHEELVQLLIKAKANINKRSNYGITHLILSEGLNHKDIVQLLIDKGANVNEKNNDGDTALMLAERNGNKGIVELLEAAKNKESQNN